MSIKSKHSTGKNEKAGKKGKRKKLEDSEEMDSSEEELDLTKECHPIGHYVNDRAEMINQMFSVIKGNKLKAMLPPVLKDCDLDLLKLKCLDQLLGMSERRITCILEGEILDTSSESDVDSNEYDSDERNKSSSGSTSDGSGESLDAGYQNEVDRSKRKGKRKANSEEGGPCLKMPANDANAPAAEQGKTLLEILELEMRARAIRALLKQNETGHDGINADKDAKTPEPKEREIRDTSGEVVDLTVCEDDDFPVVAKKETGEESLIDKKVSTFEEKIEKSKVERANLAQEGEKVKRLQAEFEIRNKIFKKKIYRTRQQRLENDEEEEEDDAVKKSANRELEEVQERVIEDPEEGEVCSSDEEVSSESKREVISSRQRDDNSQKIADSDNCKIVLSDTVDSNCTASQSVSKKKEMNEGGTEEAPIDVREVESEEEILNVDSRVTADSLADETDTSRIAEETSWRDRWLKKDGVQKLVKSSKIYAKVKKRIAEKSQRFKEEIHVTNDTKSDPGNTKKLEVIEGSIEEYEKLVGKNVLASQPNDFVVSKHNSEAKNAAVSNENQK